MELRTERLLLRPQRETDVDAIVAGLNDYEVTRWLVVVPHPYTPADAREWIARQQPAEPAAAHFAVDLPGTGLIGVVGIGPGLGYWLDRRHHGNGYMTEASTALLDWHFAAMPDSVLQSGVLVGNQASLNVQKKLGFADTGIRDMRFVRSQGREIEHINTSLVRSGYEAARRRLRVN
ncbi:MAG: hypothetical protein ABS35_11430 [Kaistia sp. SCN 65-12]|mgnify:CR=1 FL=1|nr:MAG: hypothetical protein ABS35_11430 [Kaistia sp. SCN 65-12]